MRFYHGTPNPIDAESIMKNGFSLKRTGERQRTLRNGEETAEVPGVYVTNNKTLAEWYAGGIKKPGLNNGGVVIEVNVLGKIMPENDWWALRRKHMNPKASLWDKDTSSRDMAMNELIDQGFVGFQESQEEFVILDPSNVTPVNSTLELNSLENYIGESKLVDIFGC